MNLHGSCEEGVPETGTKEMEFMRRGITVTLNEGWRKSRDEFIVEMAPPGGD